MAAFRHVSKKVFSILSKPQQLPKVENCLVYFRFLSYSSIEYDDKHDPSPKFFNEEIQHLLKDLTRVDMSKVYRHRKLGGKKLKDPEYKFMTDEELEQAKEEAVKKAEELLQIPPVVPVGKPINRILSKDPALQGYEDCKMVFTDISFGVNDKDRIIVVRDLDGSLKFADWELRNRMNQLYFPKKQRMLKAPRMFFGEYLDNLLKRKEYDFLLDRACIQFEPNDPDYQRVMSVTFQHVNDNHEFDLLRSTRHFGGLTFFLVWHKNIDNFLLELIETSYIEETSKLLQLFAKIHDINFEKNDQYELIFEYIKKYSNKKAVLELALQAHKDLERQRMKLEEGIKFAHGLS